MTLVAMKSLSAVGTLMGRCYQNGNSAGEEITVKSNKVPL
jgi:hypothetical protein